MIKVTQDLKDTLKLNNNIEEIYFDKFGNHFFSAHKHERTGKFYHRIKDFNGSKTEQNANGQTSNKRVRVYEVNDDHELVDTITRSEALATPIADEVNFKDASSKEIFEKQAQENDFLKKQLEELKALFTANSEKVPVVDPLIEELKAKLAKAEEENETYKQLIEEDKSSEYKADKTE